MVIGQWLLIHSDADSANHMYGITAYADLYIRFGFVKFSPARSPTQYQIDRMALVVSHGLPDHVLVAQFPLQTICDRIYVR